MFYTLQVIEKHFSHAILEKLDKSLRHNRQALIYVYIVLVI